MYPWFTEPSSNISLENLIREIFNITESESDCELKPQLKNCFTIVNFQKSNTFILNFNSSTKTPKKLTTKILVERKKCKKVFLYLLCWLLTVCNPLMHFLTAKLPCSEKSTSCNLELIKKYLITYSSI